MLSKILEFLMPYFFALFYVVFLIPLAVPLCIATGAAVYYWFLKPISFKHACTYTLVDMASTTIGLFFAMLISKIASMVTIFQGSYVIPGIAFITLVLSSMFIMRYTFNYSYKKIAAPIIINTMIRIALIMLLDKPGLGM